MPTLDTPPIGSDDALDAPDAALPAYEDLTFACTHLCELLEIENDALACNDIETVKALTDRKTALARLYSSYMRGLSELPDSSRAFTRDQREDLLELGHRLEDLCRRNALLLRAGLDASKMVAEIIANSVRAAQDQGFVYGRGGMMRGADDKAASYTLNNLL